MELNTRIDQSAISMAAINDKSIDESINYNSLLIIITYQA